ncbi:MAG: hypothetical protein NT085_03235 [candidate division SR1 bacterium]|nr:hypothetical protein [candidate division SR1 bacterium]
MKKSLNLLFAIILIVAMNGCSKDEQARYKKVVILERTGQEIVKWEEYIKTHRSTLNPEAYDGLGEVAANATVLVVMNELKPDSGVESKSGKSLRIFVWVCRMMCIGFLQGIPNIYSKQSKDMLAGLLSVIKLRV